jgi:nucleoside-triphosphatase
LKHNIYILSGPIQTGKSTSLIEWATREDDTAGIVQPIIDNKRHITNLKTSESRLLEMDEANDNSVSVGKYNFSKPTFEWSKICLLHSYKQEPKWLIIDEFGKLELKGLGLEPVVSYLINEYKQKVNNNLLIIVRDYLLAAFLSNYKLDETNCRVIGSINEI